MNKNYDLSNLAKADLKDIWVYTEKHWGERQADKYYRSIIQTITDIANHKTVGRQFPELPNYFRVKVEQHLIFYLCHMDGQIIVSRILHQAMDIPSHLGRR